MSVLPLDPGTYRKPGRRSLRKRIALPVPSGRAAAVVPRQRGGEDSATGLSCSG
jgi:hypothetical protein